MDFTRQNRWQWGLLIVLAMGFFLYRTFTTSGEPTPANLAEHQQAIRNLWVRVPPYPGAVDFSEAALTEPGRIISERLYPASATYAAASAFYQKEFPGIGWESIGEQPHVAGFKSPVRVFRQGAYHLLLSADERGVLLRMTWTPDGNPMVDVRAQ